MIHVEPMLIANPEAGVLSANVDQAMLVILLSIVLLSPAVKILVEPMLNVNLEDDQPFANAHVVIMEILTPIVSEILAQPIPVVK